MQNNSNQPHPFETNAPVASNHTAPQRPSELKHSGPGIASFTLSALGFIMTLVLIIAAAIAESTTVGGMDADTPAGMMIGLLFLVIIILTLISGVLGIVGVCQSDRKKIFAILGLVFSSLFFVLLIFLIIIAVTLS